MAGAVSQPNVTYAALKRRSALAMFCLAQPLGAISGVAIAIMLFGGVFADFVAPYDPLTIDFGAMLAPPSWEHWMGTDAFGRDIFSRVIFGARTALTIGFFASLMGCVSGAMIGVASAYFGGRI
ncbi:MAG: ABC transporter permease, partial [Alphaproteobacteria bacterium]|nr:ABC transporter permease [Alphaproteobacteria bacterium]